jgi:hypothetical protein
LKLTSLFFSTASQQYGVGALRIRTPTTTRNRSTAAAGGSTAERSSPEAAVVAASSSELTVAVVNAPLVQLGLMTTASGAMLLVVSVLSAGAMMAIAVMSVGAAVTWKGVKQHGIIKLLPPR